MTHITNQEASLRVEASGSGKLLLFNHGFGATHRMWDGQRKAFDDAYQVVAWDMRGHGETSAPIAQEHYSEETTVSDFIALLDAHGEEKGVLIGHSLGGYMSFATYARHPERVAAIVAVCTGPGYKSDDARAKWNRFAERTGQKIAETGVVKVGGTGAEVSEARHESLDGIALAAAGMLAQRDATVMNLLPNIQVPVLVIIGSEDPAYHGAADYMERKIPNCTKVMLDGAGHAANLDMPSEFNAALDEFLKTL